MRNRPGQVRCFITEQLGEAVVDLDDGQVGVRDEEAVLHGVDQGGAPRGFVVAQACQIQVGTHAGQQIGGGERFGQVVVGASGQTLDGGFLTGPGGEKHHGDMGGGGVVAQGAQ